MEDKDGNVWFATSGGVTKYDGESFVNFTVENGLSHNDVWSILVDRAGTIWSGTLGGACRFDGKRFVPFAIPPAAEIESGADPSFRRQIVRNAAACCS